MKIACLNDQEMTIRVDVHLDDDKPRPYVVISKTIEPYSFTVFDTFHRVLDAMTFGAKIIDGFRP